MSRDVNFYEIEFPFVNASSSSPPTHKVSRSFNYLGDASLYDHGTFDVINNKGEMHESNFYPSCE